MDHAKPLVYVPLTITQLGIVVLLLCASLFE